MWSTPSGSEHNISTSQSSSMSIDDVDTHAISLVQQGPPGSAQLSGEQIFFISVTLLTDSRTPSCSSSNFRCWGGGCFQLGLSLLAGWNWSYLCSQLESTQADWSESHCPLGCCACDRKSPGGHVADWRLPGCLLCTHHDQGLPPYLCFLPPSWCCRCPRPTQNWCRLLVQAYSPGKPFWWCGDFIDDALQPRARICLIWGEVKECCTALTMGTFQALGSAVAIVEYVRNQLSSYTYTFPMAAVVSHMISMSSC